MCETKLPLFKVGQALKKQATLNRDKALSSQNHDSQRKQQIQNCYCSWSRTTRAAAVVLKTTCRSASQGEEGVGDVQDHQGSHGHVVVHME